MNPQDDPEARIRELERPLETAARELGEDHSGTGPQSTQPYAGSQYSAPQYNPYPPTTPWPADNSGYGNPSPYTVPYGTLPQQQRSSGGLRPWILMIGVAVVGLVVIGGAFTFIGFNMTGADDRIASGSNNPSGVFGGGGSVDENPVAQPTVTVSIPTAAPAAPSEVVPPGGEISIAGVGQTKTITCNENSLTVSGVSNTITVTGHCLGVTVSGMQNKLIVEDADTITASGVDNKVTYRNGTPDVVNSGYDNIVEQG